jgi:hypothetical protein
VEGGSPRGGPALERLPVLGVARVQWEGPSVWAWSQQPVLPQGASQFSHAGLRSTFVPVVDERPWFPSWNDPGGWGVWGESYPS